MSRPSWFTDDSVIVSTARTCGINKDGHDLFVIDQATGQRTNQINDELADDITAITEKKHSDSVRQVPLEQVLRTGICVPVYYDRRYHEEFVGEIKSNFTHLTVSSIRSLIDSGDLVVKKGHGSPSLDLRRGDIPYIKVSDLRAGSVNINATNMIPRILAVRYWRGAESGLKPFDLISPERASKNIGDFCVLMPGQEQVVLTKEVLVFRAADDAPFDQFYLLWAMSLKVVRRQWERVVFMQTNREDVGERFKEIEIPIPSSRQEADAISAPFKAYFEGIARLRSDFSAYLRLDELHHFHLGVSEERLQDLEATNGP